MSETDPSLPLVLVAEDEAVIGMTLLPDLEEAGYRVAGPFARCDEAMAWMESSSPDLAILDVILRDGPCTALAQELRRRGVPYLVFSGDDRHAASITEFNDAPWIEKPGSFETIRAALATITPQ